MAPLITMVQASFSLQPEKWINYCDKENLYVDECNLGEVKLEPMLSAAVRSGHAWGSAFTVFAEGVFVLYSSYVFVCCLPDSLAIVECLLLPLPPPFLVFIM